jgi:acyl-CoA thioester hydrolase
MSEWHEFKLRVRFEETDALQVVYYSKYLVWFEVGRISLMREAGIPYPALASRGMHTPVVQAHADYKASARFDDEVLVKTRVASIGRSSIRFENEVYKLPEMVLVCTGHTVHTLINEEGKSIAVPDDLRSKFLSS